MTEILQNVQVFAPRRRRRRQSYDNTSLFSSKTAELKIDFWPSWISNRNDFTYFLSTIVTHSFKSTGLSFQKKQKIDFQDGSHSCYLGFLIRMILTTFYLQVVLLPSFKSVVLSVQEKKQKTDFKIAIMVAILDF